MYHQTVSIVHNADWFAKLRPLELDINIGFPTSRLFILVKQICMWYCLSIKVLLMRFGVQTVTVRVCVSECSKACARGNPVQEIVQPYAAPMVFCPSAAVRLTWLSSKSFLSSVCTLPFAESENINKKTKPYVGTTRRVFR